MFYLAAGCILLMRADHMGPSGWAVGGVFGPGHLATAIGLAFGKREDIGD
jgi:hypothetical protein